MTQHNELVIGNVHGDLLVFKGYNADGKPWAKATELGMVIATFTDYVIYVGKSKR